jgi:hypothetical protein
LVRPTEEDLGGQVPAQFAAEGARHHNGLEWELLPARRHIAAATLAGDLEGLAATGSWEHRDIVGEQKANTQ